MKKLMIAAAMVCATALSQASTFDWASGSVWFGPKVADFANLSVGKKLNSAVAADGTANRMQQEAATGTGKLGVVWTMTMSITDAAGTETLDPVSFTGYSSAKPKVSGVLKSDKIYTPSGDDKVEISYTMIVEGKYTDAAGNVWTITSDPINGGDKVFGSLDTELSMTSPSSAIPTSWTVTAMVPGAIPEPTSGLLLLLGVAGLALRRRRA